MARVRQLLLTLASGSALYSGMVPALGLGEISLHSALNQPLEAEIELLQIGDLNADEIKVRLASAEDFNRSGVDRFMFLNDLRFTPVLRGGRNTVRVVSSKPVREPYLNFIVEVQRPGGSLLREYTLLIDPPGSSAYNPVASTPQPVRYAESPAPARLETPRPAPARPLPVAAQGQPYRVQRGDSLWSIAGRLRAAGSQASQQALMDDIQALNPDAFIAGDPSRLRLAAELRLPDSAVPKWIAPDAPQPAPAVAHAAQTAPAARADSTPPAVVEPAVEAAAVAETPVELQPLAAAQRTVDSELASQTTENQALQAAIGDLQTQLAQLQAQMGEKDRQLASIRAELEQQRQLGSESAPATVAPATPPAVAAAPASPAEASLLPLWLSAGGLCLVLIGGIWMLRRKVNGRQPQPYPQAQVRPTAQVASTPAALPVVGAVARPATPLAPVREPGVPADPIEAANVYIAYGHFGEARAVLRKAVEQEPQRLDLRLRLLAVLGELGDASGFFAEQDRLLELGASHVQVDQIRARYTHLERPSEAGEFAVELPLNEEVEPIPLAQDDFQLNLDDLSLDADWDLVTPFEADTPLRAKQSDEPEFDPAFRSDLRELPEVFELTVDKDGLSSFGDLPLPEASEDDVLQEEFVDAFVVTEPARSKPLESNLEHLAGNREHLARLNMALAYIEQGNVVAACDILNTLIDEGSDQERARARELLAQIA